MILSKINKLLITINNIIMRKHLFPVLLLANTLWSCLFAQTPIVMDMVHHNPGEPFTNTWFNEPGNLVQYGFNAQVVNEFQSVHAGGNPPV